MTVVVTLGSLALTGCLAACLYGQQSGTDLLRLAQTRIAESLDRLPQYMCTLNIDRKAYRRSDSARSSACDDGGKQLTLMSSDRLRLDVAKSNIEMYSWVVKADFKIGIF
jgi:hypothetical protein